MGMKDVCGNELAIGDKVVTTASNYEELRVMYVHSFTPKGCRLSKTLGDESYLPMGWVQYCNDNPKECK